MFAVLLKAWILKQVKRAIVRKGKKIMLRKLIERTGITGLVVGLVSYVSGYDLAPADVDVLVSAASILATVGPAIVVGIKNKFFSKE